MKKAKMLLSLLLLATMPTDALAASRDTSAQCIRVFPTSWAAYMMMPCWAGFFR
jgi:hypothetical protein